jgi:hypothetical protein
MNKPKGIVYKARYVIEMEISEEYYSDNDDNQFVGSFPKIIAYPPEIIIRDLESVFFQHAAKSCSYIEKHFPDEAKHVCAQMHDLEQLTLSGYPPHLRRNARKGVIGDLKKQTDTRARKRLTTPRGRSKGAKEKIYPQDVERLKQRILSVMQKIGVKKKIKKGEVARKLYSFGSKGCSNEYQKLDRELNKNSLDYKDILDQHYSKFNK